MQRFLGDIIQLIWYSLRVLNRRSAFSFFSSILSISCLYYTDFEYQFQGFIWALKWQPLRIAISSVYIVFANVFNNAAVSGLDNSFAIREAFSSTLLSAEFSSSCTGVSWFFIDKKLLRQVVSKNLIYSICEKTVWSMKQISLLLRLRCLMM